MSETLDLTTDEPTTVEETTGAQRAKEAHDRANNPPEWKGQKIFPVTPDRQRMIQRIAKINEAECFDGDWLLAGFFLALTIPDSNVKRALRVGKDAVIAQVHNAAEKHIVGLSMKKEAELDNLLGKVIDDAQAAAVEPDEQDGDDSGNE